MRGERLGAQAFGSAALGDPDFVEGLLCGGGAGLRMDKVDAVLGFMGEPPLGPLFACEVDICLSITEHRRRTGSGLAAVAEAAFARRLRAGHAPLPGKVNGVRRWMGLHSSSAQRRAIALGDAVPGLVAERTRGGGPARAVPPRGGYGLQRGVRSAPSTWTPRQAAAMVGLESANDGILPDHRGKVRRSPGWGAGSAAGAISVGMACLTLGWAH